MAKIMIDPGHGGVDSGAGSNPLKEEDFTLKLSLAIRDFLAKNYKVELLLTRTTDTTVSLKQRTDMANAAKVDFFLSIHINDATAESAEGFESYVYNGQVTANTLKYQNIIHKAVIDAIGKKYAVTDRGVKKADFHVLRETNMEAILLENLFISNDKDYNLLSDKKFLQTLANAIGTGVATALNLTKK